MVKQTPPMFEKLFYRKAPPPPPPLQIATKSASVNIDQRILDQFSGVSPVKNPVTAYQVIPDVFLVTDFVTNQIAKLPLQFKTANGDVIDPKRNTDLMKLIKQPNYYENWPELIKQFFTFYEVLGNAYLYKTKSAGFNQPQSLFAIPTQGMKVLLARDKNTNPAWANSIAGYQFNMGGVDTNFDTDEVLMKRYVNMNYQQGTWIYGLSKYIPAEKINTDLAAIYDARTSIITKRGALGFVTNKTSIPNIEQSKAVQDALNRGSQYGVLSHQDKTIVTAEDLAWVQMSMNIGELQLIENAGYDFDKICQLNGIDPVVFSTQGSTFANKSIALKSFITNVLVPKITDFYTDFNEWLSDNFNGETVWPDWDAVKELQEDRSALTTDLEKQIRSGMLTPRAAHEILYGEVDNNASDEYYFTTNIVTQESVDDVQPLPIPEPIVNGEDLIKMYNGNKKITVQSS